MRTREEASSLASTFLRLRSDLSAEMLPVDESFWKRLTSGELGTFHGEYLISVHAFESDWDVWEMHPGGDEIVCLLTGRVTFALEEAGGVREVDLRRCGDFALVPRGIWHTARVAEAASVLFITPGEGTQNRKTGT